jgi:midasin
MHDMEMEDRENEDPSEDEDGDDERIEQEMGDTGDQAEAVDEKMWGDDDDKDGKEKKEQSNEKDATVQVSASVFQGLGFRVEWTR